MKDNTVCLEPICRSLGRDKKFTHNIGEETSEKANTRKAEKKTGIYH
jgi:hypothetical protein